jgi:hypothetical protein
MVRKRKIRVSRDHVVYGSKKKRMAPAGIPSIIKSFLTLLQTKAGLFSQVII